MMWFLRNFNFLGNTFVHETSAFIDQYCGFGGWSKFRKIRIVKWNVSVNDNTMLFSIVGTKNRKIVFTEYFTKHASCSWNESRENTLKQFSVSISRTVNKRFYFRNSLKWIRWWFVSLHWCTAYPLCPMLANPFVCYISIETSTHEITHFCNELEIESEFECDLIEKFAPQLRKEKARWKIECSSKKKDKRAENVSETRTKSVSLKTINCCCSRAHTDTCTFALAQAKCNQMHERSYFVWLAVCDCTPQCAKFMQHFHYSRFFLLFFENRKIKYLIQFNFITYSLLHSYSYGSLFI